MNIKTKNKFIKLSILTSVFFLLGSINSNALEVESVKLKNQPEAFYDKEVPYALRVLKTDDGLEAGTILFRYVHEGIDYYSPVVPEEYRGSSLDVQKGAYNNWGPWRMKVNQEFHNIEAHSNYKSAVVAKTVEVHTSENADGYTGTLEPGTKLKPLSFDDTRNKLFFDLTAFPELNKHSTTGVGMIYVSDGNVTLSGREEIMHDNWKEKDDNKHYLYNFKKLAKYTNNTSANYIGLEEGRYHNPNRNDVPKSVRDKNGEWRYLGYNAKGQPLNNPYFPAEKASYASNSDMWAYPWRQTPWDKTDAESDEQLVDIGYNIFTNGKTDFPYDKKDYTNEKRAALKKLYDMGALRYSVASLDYMMSRLSLDTHPTKQSPVFYGQNKYTGNYRVAIIRNPNLRDIYIDSITIIDNETNDVIARFNGNPSGNSNDSYKTATVKRNRSYTARVVLANGANSELLVPSLESHIGFTYNASSVNMNMPFSEVYDSQTIILGNKGGFKGTKGEKSNNFDFEFSVPNSLTKGHMDLYGFVGMNHQGVDNLNYKNDIGAIRLYIDPTPPTDNEYYEDINPGDGSELPCTVTSDPNVKICGGGDLRPVSIQIFDGDNPKNVVFDHKYGESTPRIKKGLIPGKKYKISYTVGFFGKDITEHRWVPTINDNPDTPQNEYVAGHWDKGKVKEYEVPMNYYIEKYSGGPRDLDSISKSIKLNRINNPNNTKVPMANTIRMEFETENIMFQYPYIKTNMDIKMNDIRVNFNKNNDRFETSIKDNFDIIIKDIRVTPAVTYVPDKSQTIDYNVSYDAELVTPSYVTSEDYQAYIDTAININGHIVHVKDQLVKGTEGNKNITHLVENVPINSFGKSEVIVNLNSDKKSYETGNFDNNIGSTNIEIVQVKDPAKGSPTDTVKKPDSIGSNNPNKGGDANNNCLTPRTKNTWTSTHRKFSWNSNNINYNKISNNTSVNFNKYYTEYEKLNEATETYSEEFGIKKILFRSKDTKDKGYGNDGWIDLLDIKDGEKPIIKAGYGFELEIVTEYSTDALTKRTWTLSDNGKKGTAVSALNTKPNYGLEDVFLELPGTEKTRKILSSTGFGDTTVGLNVEKEINEKTGNATWTYTIKPSDTLGIGEIPKIFIPKDVVDGDYTLKIYTPPVSGIGSVNKDNYSALCDRKEVVITVDGAAMDDLNSHETQ